MSLFRGIRTASILLTLGISIFAATDALAASAPMPISQLCFTRAQIVRPFSFKAQRRKDRLFSITRTPGLKPSPRNLKRSIRSSKLQNGVPEAGRDEESHRRKPGGSLSSRRRREHGGKHWRH